MTWANAFFFAGGAVCGYAIAIIWREFDDGLKLDDTHEDGGAWRDD